MTKHKGRAIIRKLSQHLSNNIQITTNHVRKHNASMTKSSILKDYTTAASSEIKREVQSKDHLGKVYESNYIDEISFDNFNDLATLISIVKRHKTKHRLYPGIIGANKIYETKKLDILT